MSEAKNVSKADYLTSPIENWIIRATSGLADFEIPAIEKEYRAHFEDLLEGKSQTGKSDTSIEQECLHKMGSPWTVGTELEKIHITRKELKEFLYVKTRNRYSRLFEIVALSLFGWVVWRGLYDFGFAESTGIAMVLLLIIGQWNRRFTRVGIHEVERFRRSLIMRWALGISWILLMASTSSTRQDFYLLLAVWGVISIILGSFRREVRAYRKATRFLRSAK